MAARAIRSARRARPAGSSASEGKVTVALATGRPVWSNTAEAIEVNPGVTSPFSVA